MTRTTAPAMSAWQEIRLVAMRELRTHLLKKSSVISTLVMLALSIGGIVAYSIFGTGAAQPYRVTVAGASESTAAVIEQYLSHTDVNGAHVDIVAPPASTDDPAALLCQDGDDSLDAVIDATTTPVTIRVCEEAPSAITSTLTAALQEDALLREFSELGGAPDQLRAALTSSAPVVEAVNPPRTTRTRTSGPATSC